MHVFQQKENILLSLLLRCDDIIGLHCCIMLSYWPASCLPDVHIKAKHHVTKVLTIELGDFVEVMLGEDENSCAIMEVVELFEDDKVPTTASYLACLPQFH